MSKVTIRTYTQAPAYTATAKVLAWPVPLPFSFFLFFVSRENYVSIIIIRFKFTDKQQISCHRIQPSISWQVISWNSLQKPKGEKSKRERAKHSFRKKQGKREWRETLCYASACTRCVRALGRMSQLWRWTWPFGKTMVTIEFFMSKLVQKVVFLIDPGCKVLAGPL